MEPIFKRGGGGHCLGMVMDVIDPLNQVLESKHSVQQFVTASLPLAFLISASVARTGTLFGPLPPPPSFSIQPVHLLLPPLGSHGSEVSKKMVLRLRAQLFFFKSMFKLFILQWFQENGELSTQSSHVPHLLIHYYYY